MAGLDRAPRAADGLIRVRAPARGPSGRVALGAVLVALAGIVAVGLIGQASGGGPEPNPVVDGLAALPTAATGPWSAGPRVSVPGGVVRRCPSGSTPDAPGPVAQARPPLSYVAPMAFDRRTARIVLLAGDPNAGAETWTFDICTNTWSRMHPDLEPPPWSTLVYDVAAGVTVAFDGWSAWTYDVADDAWTKKAVAPLGLQGRQYPRGAYDARSGLVVLLTPAVSEPTARPEGLWTYDVENDAWRAVHQADAPPAGPSGEDRAVPAYDASVDRLITYDPLAAVTRLFDFGVHSWSRSAAPTPKLQFGWTVTGGEIAYDEAIGRMIVFGFGRMISYDAASDAWEVLAAGNDPDQPAAFAGPTSRQRSWMVYDPVNERLVVYGGEYRRSVPVDDSWAGAWADGDDVLAFDPVTREWTTLLGASMVQSPQP